MNQPRLTIVRLEIVADKDKLDVTVTGVPSADGEKLILYTQAFSISRTEHAKGCTRSIFQWKNLLSWLQTQGISSLAVGNLIVSPLTASILTVGMSPEILKLSLEVKTYGNSITTSTGLLTLEQSLNSSRRWTNLSDLEVLQQMQNRL